MIPILSSPPFGDNVAPAPCQLPPQRAIPGRQGYTTGGSSCFVVAVVVKRLKIWVKQRALDWTWGQSGCFEGTNKTYKDLCRITWMSWENSTVEKSVESLDLGGTMMVSRRLSLHHKNGDFLHHPKHVNANKHILKPNLSKHAAWKHP